MAPKPGLCRRARAAPLDVHRTARSIDLAVARLRAPSARIPAGSAEAILEFVRATEGAVSRQRTLTYLQALPGAAKRLGGAFLNPDRETPTRFKEAYRDYAFWTLATGASCLVRFWRWRYERDGKEFPGWLRIPLSKRFANHKGAGDVLSPEEVDRLAAACPNARDKAFVLTLYESGARVGELLVLRVADVERTEYGGIRLQLPDGKTGPRTVPLFEAAVPALLTWLRQHPKADDPSSPVWCHVQQAGRDGVPITYNHARQMIRDAARRAGISKPVNPHNFRHSRATTVAKDAQVPTAVFEKMFGWARGSPIAQEYVHLSARDVEEALMRKHGIVPAEQPGTSPRLPRRCARCQWPNDAQARFCTTCGGALDLKAATELEEKEKQAERLAALLEDPAVRRVMVERYAVRLRERSRSP